MLTRKEYDLLEEIRSKTHLIELTHDEFAIISNLLIIKYLEYEVDPFMSYKMNGNKIDSKQSSIVRLSSKGIDALSEYQNSQISKCNICSTDKRPLLKHVSLNPDSWQVRCPECDFRTPTNNSLSDIQAVKCWNRLQSIALAPFTAPCSQNNQRK